jgi:hypothetical protein
VHNVLANVILLRILVMYSIFGAGTRIAFAYELLLRFLLFPISTGLEHKLIQ